MSSDSDLEDCKKKYQVQQALIPKTVITKVVNEVLPRDFNSTKKEIIDILQVYTSEFISLIASEANQIVEKRQRSLIQEHDILEATKILDFDQYYNQLLISDGDNNNTGESSNNRNLMKGKDKDVHLTTGSNNSNNKKRRKMKKVKLTKEQEELMLAEQMNAMARHKSLR